MSKGRSPGTWLSVLVLLAYLSVSGCAAGVAGIVESEDQSKRTKFRRSIEVANAERVKQGLLPLDLCSQSYWRNRRWATKVDSCLARIHRWEFGDSTALDPIGMALAKTVPVVPDSVQRIYDKKAKEEEFLYGPRR